MQRADVGPNIVWTKGELPRKSPFYLVETLEDPEVILYQVIYRSNSACRDDEGDNTSISALTAVQF